MTFSSIPYLYPLPPSGGEGRVRGEVKKALEDQNYNIVVRRSPEVIDLTLKD
jgi:hypothetical protein